MECRPSFESDCMADCRRWGGRRALFKLLQCIIVRCSYTSSLSNPPYVDWCRPLLTLLAISTAPPPPTRRIPIPLLGARSTSRWSEHPPSEELFPALHPTTGQACDGQNLLPDTGLFRQVPPVGAGRSQCMRLVALRAGATSASGLGAVPCMVARLLASAVVCTGVAPYTAVLVTSAGVSTGVAPYTAVLLLAKEVVRTEDDTSYAAPLAPSIGMA